MKKYVLFLLFAFISICFAASCQTEKGSWLIGGNGSLDFIRKPGFSSNQNSYKQFDASLSPIIGFFVFNNFAFGASIPLSISTTTDYNGHSIGMGPLVRYYLGKGRIKVFPEAKVEFNRLVSKYEQLLTEFNNISRTNTYKIGPGIAYFIANNLALEGVLNFYAVSGRYNQNYSHSWIDRQGINLNVGLQFYLPKKQ